MEDRDEQHQQQLRDALGNFIGAAVGRARKARERTTDIVTIDLSTWPRREEVDEYARTRGISREQAIHELVNTGLQ